ncbi:hypothetical protein HYH03_003418 [Edaphochlamys debaryana]|uniref:Kazal-like domain-containing protein n=1 Tax=Edaphochlamys debaryana TaxID=47281 RepID=A0A836C4A1_9CHLO|nr:hypothetical protein HYH03_003418 [Edaphochlamys debaryana]|eukprot:KAG2498673.1 hypothetical protein HYH03_003418 [Edaphochlamys debaryana]
MCGPDGKTFWTPCGDACRTQPSVHIGPCADATPKLAAAGASLGSCGCEEGGSPVCAVNGTAWDNPCYAICTGTAAACRGSCPRRPFNESTFDAASAACNCPSPGPAEAVCAVDGTTYASACLARCANAAVAYDGSCPLTMTAMTDPNVALPMCGWTRGSNSPRTFEPGSSSPGSAQHVAPLLPPGLLLALTAAVGAALLLLV